MEFSLYHPIVNFLYFFTVIAFSMFCMNPIVIFIGLFAGLIYSIILNGKKAVSFNLKLVLPLAIITALLNPAFNHEGMHILLYLPSGNPLTLESIVYGISAALMLASVVLYFSCFNRVMTSDKIMYILGRGIPSLSLIFSMILGFVPRFRRRMTEVQNANLCLGREVTNNGLISKVKNGVNIISIMTTWSLESAVVTADSMKSRGFGTRKRTFYSNYHFTLLDLFYTILILMFAIYFLIGIINGELGFVYFPSISKIELSPYTISLFSAYALLCFMPIIIEIKEGIKWKILKSKI